MSASHLYTYAQVITLNFLYCSRLNTAFQYREQDSKFLPAKKGATRRGAGMWVAVVRDAGSSFAQVSFYFLLLWYFSRWGSERWCRCIGVRHWLIAGVVMPNTFIGL